MRILSFVLCRFDPVLYFLLIDIMMCWLAVLANFILFFVLLYCIVVLKQTKVGGSVGLHLNVYKLCNITMQFVVFFFCVGGRHYI